jgi:hypothetical protein
MSGTGRALLFPFFLSNHRTVVIRPDVTPTLMMVAHATPKSFTTYMQCVPCLFVPDPEGVVMKIPLVVMRRVIGSVCVVLGIIGIPIPFVPLYMLLFVGIAILGPQEPAVRALMLWTVRRIRSIKSHQTPWVAQSGAAIDTFYKRTRSILAPRIAALEATLVRWTNATPQSKQQ